MELPCVSHVDKVIVITLTQFHERSLASEERP